jgi:hypothetical protein
LVRQKQEAMMQSATEVNTINEPGSCLVIDEARRVRRSVWSSSVLLKLMMVGFAASALGFVTPVEAEDNRNTQSPQHTFACADYTQGKVFIVSKEGKVEWEYQTQTCNDLWVLANGNLLFNTGHGVREVTRAKEVVFDYQSKSEIYACQRLTNGNTFIGECNSGRLLEVEPSGKIAKELRLLPQDKDGGHLYMRNARRLENGNYLVTHYGDGVVKEYDPNGKVLKEIPAQGGPHSAVRLPDGNTLIACGDTKGGPRVFEAGPDGKVVWQVQGDELPGISLKFMAGLHRLPNGNTVMSNWLGHNHFGEAPHLIEITRDKRVVWSFSDHKTMKTIASVVILDASGRSNPLNCLH